MKTILVMGATSAIAMASARLWARQGASFFLVARDAVKLEAAGQDLRARGAASVTTHVMDALDTAGHVEMLETAQRVLGLVDVALIAHGTLPDQARCEGDVQAMMEALASNATSVMALLTIVAPMMERQGQGTVAVITSVAGDRGRPSNYVYGSAKAAVSTFCEGLRARLFRSGVAVVDIRPGFVDTPMTAHLDLPGLLLAKPDAVARRVVKAVERGSGVVYAPAFWWWILLVVRSLPLAVFKRLKL